MNLAKKALSIGTSAALVASLLATVVAPSAFGAVTVGSAGNVPVGGTSANNVSFTFQEQTATSLTNAPGNFTVVLGPTGVTFSGTPSVATSSGSLGASASVAGNTLSVSFTGSDTANIESIIITGLKLSAASGTATGAITATITGFGGQFASAAAVGTAFSAGGTASGYLATGVGIGSHSATVNVTTTGCPFVATTTAGAGLFAFAAGVAGTTAESLAGTLGTGGGTGQQVLTITPTAGFASAHNAGDVVTQTVACGGSTILASPGTVVSAVTYSSAGNATVYPGENNSPADNLTLSEPSAGFLAAGSTFTFTIATPGVVFSTAPSVGEITTGSIVSSTGANPVVVTLTAPPVGLTVGATVTIAGANATGSGINGTHTVTAVSGSTFSFVPTVVPGTGGAAGTASWSTSLLGLSAPVLSADRLSATVTVGTASLVPATIVLSSILYDVSASVPAGTFVSVGLATSAAQAIISTPQTNAVVFRGIAASAPSPTVYIGENNQTAGLITFKESQAGFFTAGVGTGTNTIEICPTGTTYTFTTAPVAMVVGGVAAGNIILRDGAAASTTNIVTGIQSGSCYYWYVWTASTTASTIVIGAAPSAATGPLINVNVAQAPGGVDTNLLVGSSDVDATLFATVQFATAVYRNQVAVTALSQPVIQPGSANAAAGNLQIAETGIGQLKAGEAICVEVLWRSGINQDTFLNSLNTANLPVVAASGTGLVIGPVSPSRSGCTGQTNAVVPVEYMQSFSFPVYQQSTAGDGKLVISNISYTTLADAPSGPVLLSVWGLGGAPTVVIFHSTVANATIGVAPKLSIAANSALGLNPTSGYTMMTPKYQAVGKYVTWKFTGGPALAGQRVNILVAKHINGAWGGPVYLKSAWADANGIVTFAWTSKTAAAINVRVQWPGSTAYAVSTSKALGAYYK